MPETSYRKPLPRINELSGPHWEGLKRHELLIQRCIACGKHWFPPSHRCPACLSIEYEWAPVSGKAHLWSWIHMWQRYYPAFEAEIPYNVAYVELEEGVRMMTNLVDVDLEDLRCDMPLEPVFEDVTADVTLLKFRPAQS
jgi:hypothetical protein